MTPLDNVDQDLLGDFITESSELIEAIDQGLVKLETSPGDLELLNNIFRALHTIKGSASFLGLDPLTRVAHAAEDALNFLRKGQVSVTSSIADALLQAADTIRIQIEQLGEGAMCDEGPGDLVETLIAVGNTVASPATAENPTTSAVSSPTEGTTTDGAIPIPGGTPIDLDDSKRDLLPFMVDDLLKSIQEISIFVSQAWGQDLRARSATQILEMANDIERAVDFFGIEALSSEVKMFRKVGQHLAMKSDAEVEQVLPRLSALMQIMRIRSNALKSFLHLDFDTSSLRERMMAVLEGEAIPDSAILPNPVESEHVLGVDGVIDRPEKEPSPDEASERPPGTATATPKGSPDLELVDPPAAAAAPMSASSRDTAGTGVPAVAGRSQDPATMERPTGVKQEQTIRVDVSRLEQLLNLIGELVLQKNRVLAVSRSIQDVSSSQEINEQVTQIASDLDRVTGDLQLGVMKARLQPLNKIFSRYPRIIRDLARSTNKKIELQIAGGDTEVDKSVIESLGDPLVHILRNSADHGLETPDERIAAGKSETGTIKLSAEHHGNHVLVQIRDDGRGIDPEKVGARALERGLVTPDELALMSKLAILRLIFQPGFSTAERVSNLSGRGVGMDVVLTNIQALNGTVEVDSDFGSGSVISMRIPLTVAIMPAMVVEVGPESYAVPLSNILEIVKPEESQVSTINGERVMRLREDVMQIIDLSEAFDCSDEYGECPFAVVVCVGEDRLALLVHQLIGQQEVVIKPLDDVFDRSGMISGATVREDGGVSLILDINGLLKAVNQAAPAAA